MQKIQKLHQLHFKVPPHGSVIMCLIWIEVRHLCNHYHPNACLK